MFLKTQIYSSVDDHYEATISLSEIADLSDSEIVEKLFTMYLEHYKDKPLFNDQQIKNYKIINAAELKYAVANGTPFMVEYLIQQHFWNEYWEIGGRHTKDGMTEKLVFVSLIKEKEQYRLRINGTLPPEPK